MKKGFMFLFLLAVTLVGLSQGRKYSTYYYQKATLYEKLPVSAKDIVFLGNSITDGGEWAELFENPFVKNRGISGDVVGGVYDRLEPILKGKPAKLFLMIGINDVAAGRSADTIVEGIEKIIDRFRRESPHTKFYLQSLLPVNDCYGMFKGHTSRGDVVKEINARLRDVAREKEITYIDLYSSFSNADGKLVQEYTNDGLHLLGEGYLLWKKIVLPYVKE